MQKAVVRESWYSDDYETLADRKFADRPSDDPDSDEDDAAELSDMQEDLRELIEDFDSDPGHETESGFFLSLLRESGGKFLSHREEGLVEEMKQAILRILLDANSNKYEGEFPSFKR